MQKHQQCSKLFLRPGILGLLCLLLLLNACKKTTVAEAFTTDDEIAFSQTGDTLELVIKPGAKGGWDTYVNNLALTENFNWSGALLVGCVPAGGGSNFIVTYRTFIKFAKLSLVPANAHVISARMHLTGVDSSRPWSGGNTSYPNSPYHTSNKCLVQRVVGSDWNDRQLSWNTMPATTIEDEVAFGPSDSKWNYDPTINVTEMVKKMIAEPEKNYGFCIRLKTEEKTRFMSFLSCEDTNPHERPKLIVRYTL